MPEYRGPISLNDLESVLGDFNRVRMVPVEGGVLELAPGQRQLTTLGYIWPCGCESRGTGTPDWAAACRIRPCRQHRMDFEELPVLGKADDPPETFVVERQRATMKPGEILVLTEQLTEGDET